MINEGVGKKKCKCLPPTQCEINQNQSPGRKEGRKDGSKEGRQAGSGRAPWSLCTARQPSVIITWKHTHTHRSTNSLRTAPCQKIQLLKSCDVFTVMRRRSMDGSAGASGRAFLMLFSKYKRQYELCWMRLYPPTQTTLCWQCLSLEPGQPTIYQKRLSVSIDLRPLALCSIESVFSNSTILSLSLLQSLCCKHTISLFVMW